MNALLEVVAPVALLVLAGIAASRFGVVDAPGIKATSSLAFALFLPALLFRSLATRDFATLDPTVPIAYFAGSLPLYLGVWFLLRRAGLGNARATIRGLGAVFANTVMLGIPLVRLAFGEAGLGVLLTVVMVHTLVLLGVASVLLAAGEPRRGGVRLAGNTLAALLTAARATLVNPVVVPLIAGVLWSLSGLVLPAMIDRSLALLGAAAVPVCLVLLGASLASQGLGQARGALVSATLLKSVAHPLVVYAAGRWLVGLDPLALAVLTVNASLPVGVNVYLLAQRHDADPGFVSGAVVTTTVSSAVTLPILLSWFA